MRVSVTVLPLVVTHVGVFAAAAADEPSVVASSTVASAAAVIREMCGDLKKPLLVDV